MKSATGKAGPDTTEPTLEAVYREIEHLRELLEGRLDGMDEAVKVLHSDVVRVPTDLDKAISGLRELLEAKEKGLTDLSRAKIDANKELAREKFKAAKELSEAKLKCAKELSKAMIDAMKEASYKNEQRMLSEVKSLNELMRKADESCDDKVTEIRNRLTMIEGRTLGQQTAEKRTEVNWTLLLTAGTFLTGIAVLLVMALK